MKNSMSPTEWKEVKGERSRRRKGIHPNFVRWHHEHAAGYRSRAKGRLNQIYNKIGRACRRAYRGTGLSWRRRAFREIYKKKEKKK